MSVTFIALNRLYPSLSAGGVKAAVADGLFVPSDSVPAPDPHAAIENANGTIKDTFRMAELRSMMSTSRSVRGSRGARQLPPAAKDESAGIPSTLLSSR